MTNSGEDLPEGAHVTCPIRRRQSTAGDENPYASPKTSDLVVGIKSGRREDLKSVAMAQKSIIVPGVKSG